MPVQYNHDHENEISLFASVNYRNQFRRFGIKTDDRRRHIYVIGKTGMGKTTLLENMVLSDILAGHGACYIDPHGDTAEKLLDYIPSNRINDVVYFNPADMDFPVGFNILESLREEQKHLVASGLMGVFKKIWPDVWSARMEYILLNCVLALLDFPGATLLGISRLLVDKDYRARVTVKIRNPIVKTFWMAEFASWSEKYATEAIAPVLNKVGQFLSASIIRNIVAQVKSTIDPRKIMDEGKILIVNLAKGKIGEDNMRLLGGMIVTKIQLAAMERVDIKNEIDRRDFYLYVDEFQNFANESFASILSEARKYRLNLVVAHQYIAQLSEEVAKAVFGNVGSILAMRVGGEDAQFMENEFSPIFTPEDLTNLPKYQMYLKLMVDGVATAPFSAITLPPIANRTGSEQKVVAVSRERYSEPRSVIEEKVLRWSGMETDVSGEYPSIVTAEEKEAGEEAVEKPAGGEAAPAEEREFLRFSPERLKAMEKPAGSKKEKPKFPHTCTRCGKVWEMPIQLDPTRPMYCSECLPLVREDNKMKKTVLKTALKGGASLSEKGGIVIEAEEPANKNAENKLGVMFDQDRSGEGTRPGPVPADQISRQPNRPRLVGKLKDFHTFAKVSDRPVAGNAEKSGGKVHSLVGDLERAKGKRIETNKNKLEKGSGYGNPQKQAPPKKQFRSGSFNDKPVAPREAP
ncbi:type IV secretion system DNA-binding domain-containing protein, partial [Patescibacteria group bacterium]|nr:type IV secretion system DNA-binding domain-containing protein [Patescibacteria group bacterium]